MIDINKDGRPTLEDCQEAACRLGLSLKEEEPELYQLWETTDTSEPTAVTQMFTLHEMACVLYGLELTAEAVKPYRKCVENIVEVMYPMEDPDQQWNAQTLELVAGQLQAHGFLDWIPEEE